MTASTLTQCPARCVEHVDNQHVGTVIMAIRASVSIDSWDEMDDEWRARYGNGAYMAWSAAATSTLCPERPFC